jgi:threonyl-tRNA synthetase
MKAYKEKLAQELTKAVGAVIGNVSLKNACETNEGFYCDYDMQTPLNPEVFDRISMQMDEAGKPYYLSHFSGVYEDGDADKKTLQRIYVVAFETLSELDGYQKFISEASERDHKNLGRRLKLFSTSDEIGQGLILWHPKGAMLRHLLEKFSKEAHILNDYQWVVSPHIGRAQLWMTSGHLDFYKDAMYSPIKIDEEEYYLKPMNCPFHIHIYNSEVRSYRELPMRLAEFGTVYRYELSGALNGLTRVRGFTQDDAHIICTEEQIAEEVGNALKFSLYILRSFGFDDFSAYVSTRPEKKFIGSDDQWNMATEVLKNAVSESGLEYKIDEGGGAFYGPKIDLKLNDSLGREWQCSTIQFDFNLPERFKMTYVGKDGSKHTPLMVHRALFGSFERFIALLIEHYKGDFPFWLSPVQFGIVPIKEEHNDYCKRLSVELKKRGFRVVADFNEGNMRGKIKQFEQERIPYMLVVGDKEVQAKKFSVRSRKNGDLGQMDIDSLCAYLKPETDIGVPKYIY